MRRVILTILGVLLTLGGILALGFAAAAFLHAVPAGAAVSQGEIGLYLPWYTVPGILAAALGLILLTFQRHW